MSVTSNDWKLPPTYVDGWSDRTSVESIPYRKLGRTNIHASLISLGTGHVALKVTGVQVIDATRHESSKYAPDNVKLLGADEAIQAICVAVRLGINFIDTSPFYGQGKCELVLGQALQKIPRKSYYIATKVGRKSDCTFDYSSEWVTRSVEESLVRLNVAYIDLIQIHDVEFGDLDVVLNQTLPALDALRARGKVRYVGITGYPVELLKTIVESSQVQIDTVLSYCRYTLFDTKLEHYLAFFESRGLGIVNAAIMGMGLFCTNRAIPAWHPAPIPMQEACQRAAKMCEEKGIHIAKLITQFVMQETRIHTHLLGMESESVVRANIAAMTSKPSQEEQQLLATLVKQIFEPLDTHDWENVELQHYRSNPMGFVYFLRAGGQVESDKK